MVIKIIPQERADWRVEVKKLEKGKITSVRSFSMIDHHDLTVDEMTDKIKIVVEKNI